MLVSMGDLLNYNLMGGNQDISDLERNKGKDREENLSDGFGLIKPFHFQEEIIGQEEKVGTEIGRIISPAKSSTFVGV